MVSKTRFAPSPTGFIHLGNARTAIINALAGYRRAGKDSEKNTFLLRIEDTDKERSEEQYINAICQDLQGLGIEWHEGEEIGGENEPYRQSQRIEQYEKYFTKLLDDGVVYHCFCTPEDLMRQRQEQKIAGVPPRYDGRCSRLEPEFIKQKLAKKKPYVIRFNTNIAIEQQPEIIFEDLVKGKQRYAKKEIGDFILRKADGMPTFFFANAVDDALMGVNYVFRGDDHLTNTPRQLMILNALNLPKPNYGHLSTIVGEDGTPLSKRNGSRSIKELLREGWLAKAIINYLARLGHYYADDHLMNIEQLAQGFSIDFLGQSSAKFDWQLFQHWQRRALMELTDNQLWQWMRDNVKEFIPSGKENLFASVIAQNIILPKEAVDYAKRIYHPLPDFDEQQKGIINTAGNLFFDTALNCIKQKSSFKQMCKTIQEKTGKKGKELFLPIRISLLGMAHGPDLASLLQLIPKELIVQRLKNCL